MVVCAGTPLLFTILGIIVCLCKRNKKQKTQLPKNHVSLPPTEMKTEVDEDNEQATNRVESEETDKKAISGEASLNSAKPKSGSQEQRSFMSISGIYPEFSIVRSEGEY